MAKGKSEKLCSKPGARRATLAATWLGTPVCMAIQMIQMLIAQPEKKSRVNQSISAATLRFRVGRANAASAASAGSASSSERSAEAVLSVAATATPTNQSGSARCRLGARNCSS